MAANIMMPAPALTPAAQIVVDTVVPMPNVPLIGPIGADALGVSVRRLAVAARMPEAVVTHADVAALDLHHAELLARSLGAAGAAQLAAGGGVGMH